MFRAQVVADSMAPSGVRLTTMLLTYADIIKQDLWTHRRLSKNPAIDFEFWLDPSRSSNSNRAIPTKKIITDVWRHPFCPERFPIRASTMHSSKGYLTGWRHTVNRHMWLKSRYLMIANALLMQWIGVHKQIANRPLMTWQWQTALFTGIEEWWEHFFSLRDHFAAQDEVQTIARLAHEAYNGSAPITRFVGEWHLPFVTTDERIKLDPMSCIKLSVARCARLSYALDTGAVWQFRPHDDDYALHDRLVTQTPEHAGPREHQAAALYTIKGNSGNLYGWNQLRHSDMGKLMRENAIRMEIMLSTS